MYGQKNKRRGATHAPLLIDAAIRQFALRGVANTTLTDIADAAGVTRGAIYWHFSSKSQLFNEMWQQQLPLRELLPPPASQISASDLLHHLREKFIFGLQYIAEDPRQRDLMQILYHKCELPAT
ncbi:Probable acrEF/envCD operon repressor [Raoultella terrigena]|uniref:Probable acrEF/envCD operon repressor n=1 Tax=Raoultella terrigena TaxID=577 RepID=A0A4U9D384_RAOTE|nr:Probable acrEF/envCD operon repressor [Raoultella terrigena]